MSEIKKEDFFKLPVSSDEISAKKFFICDCGRKHIVHSATIKTRGSIHCSCGLTWKVTKEFAFARTTFLKGGTFMATYERGE